MDKITKLFLTIINTIGVYTLITSPYLLWYFTNHAYGFAYPTYSYIFTIPLTVILAKLLTDWEEKKAN